MKMGMYVEEKFGVSIFLSFFCYSNNIVIVSLFYDGGVWYKILSVCVRERE